MASSWSRSRECYAAPASGLSACFAAGCSASFLSGPFRSRAPRRRSSPRSVKSGRAAGPRPPAPCRRPADPAGELLLQLRLVVDVRVARSRSARRTRRRRRRGWARSRAQEERRQRRPRAARPARCGSARAVSSSRACASPRSDEPLAEPELGATTAQLARETTWERIFAIRPSEKWGNGRTVHGRRQLEHAVAEELEPLVRGRAVRRPGAVGEDVSSRSLGSAAISSRAPGSTSRARLLVR